jgi:hypothetical protein
MKAFHETVTTAEREGTMNANAGSALRENINANHGQMVKTKAADISKWAALGGSLQGHTEAAGTWAGMSQADLAGQTGDSLQRAANAGHLEAGVSAALLDNAQLNGGLDAKQKAALSQASGRGNSPGAAAGPSSPDDLDDGPILLPRDPKGPPSSTGPNDIDIPH